MSAITPEDVVDSASISAASAKRKPLWQVALRNPFVIIGGFIMLVMVAIAVLVLRRTDPNRARPFRTPAVLIVAPLAAIGCVYLFVSLPHETQFMFVGWAIVGLIVYFLYGYRKSHVAHGSPETHELDADAPPTPVPPMPGAE